MHQFRAVKIAALLIVGIALAGCGYDSTSLDCSSAGENPANGRWLSAWGGTRTGGTAPNNATIRNVARVTTGGNAIRLRFFNLNTTTPLTIGAAHVGIRDGVAGADIVPGTNKPVTFGCGQTSVTIPPGTGSLYSDPIALSVENQDDVAVSLFITDVDRPNEFSTEWNLSYVSATGTGNLAAEESGAAFSTTSNVLYALRDVEVFTAEATGAIALLGSSSLHGSNSTRNEYRRVGDQIAHRVSQEIAKGQRKSFVNRGIGGDSLQNAFRTRMQQDIWSTVGVDTVVVWVTNDLTTRTAAAIIQDYVDLIALAHERKINVICPTWVPGAQSGPSNYNGQRDQLNDWILNSGNCDAVVDWGRQIQDPNNPNAYAPQYFSDGIHTNDAGHTLWAENTPVQEWVSLPTP